MSADRDRIASLDKRRVWPPYTAMQALTPSLNIPDDDLDELLGSLRESIAAATGGSPPGR